MKAFITSDPHYGFSDVTPTILNNFWCAQQDEEIDLVIFVGDLGSHKQEHTKKCLELYRDWFPDIQTLVVFGNHDYWDRDDVRTLDYICSETNVERLVASHPLTINNIIFYGFDGWYNTEYPPTNDVTRIPNAYQMMLALKINAENDFQKIKEHVNADETGFTKVLVTHFPSFTDSPAYNDYCGNLGWMDYITKTFDYYLVGHSHQFVDKTVDECKIINCGSDYDKPKAVILEIK